MNEWAIERMSMDGERERERERAIYYRVQDVLANVMQPTHLCHQLHMPIYQNDQSSHDIPMDVDKFHHDLVTSRNDGWEGYPLKWPLNSSWSS